MITLRNGIWYTDFRVDGTTNRIRRSTGFPKIERANALKRADEIREAMQSPIIMRMEKLPTFGYACHQALERHYKDTASYNGALTVLTRAKQHFGANTPLVDIREEQIEQFIDSLKLKGNKPATINRYNSVISKVFDLAVHVWKFHHYKPVVRHLKTNNAAKRILSREEELAMEHYFTEVVPDRDSLQMFQLLLQTGLRINELRDAKGYQIDKDRGSIYLPKTKNRNPRTVPLTNKAQEVLQARSWMPFTQRSLRGYQNRFECFREWLNPEERDGFSVKMLRHTCATRLLEQGIDAVLVKDWLGHTDIKTTLIYLTLTPNHLLAARDRIGDI